MATVEPGFPGKAEAVIGVEGVTVNVLLTIRISRAARHDDTPTNLGFGFLVRRRVGVALFVTAKCPRTSSTPMCNWGFGALL